MTKKLALFTLVLGALLIIAAQCGGGGPTAGETIFTKNGCIACHTPEDDGSESIGPSLVGIADQAKNTIQTTDYGGTATTVQEYIYESINDPSTHLVEGYVDLMPKAYQLTISADDKEILVNYLVTLK